MNTSPSARNGHLYPRSIMDSDAAATTPMSATNVLALTRNRYNITYNTAAIDAEGNLLKDKTGDLIIRPIYTCILYTSTFDAPMGLVVCADP